MDDTRTHRRMLNPLVVSRPGVNGPTHLMISDSGETLVIEGGLSMWRCEICGEDIDDQFDKCWRCAGSDREILDDETTPPDREGTLAPDDPCSQCGSRRVIPNARLDDQGQYSDGKAKVSVSINPTAWFFKGTFRGEVIGRMCCDCGHLEFRCIGDLESMWSAYEQSLKSS